ncbi:MAG: TolB family protein [Solirubrobacterales bacterium]
MGGIENGEATLGGGRQAASVPVSLVLALFLGTVGFLLSWNPELAGAAWPGTNGKVFFSSDRDGNSELYTMNGDGTGQTRLTSTPGDEFGPSVSANGRWVTFLYNPTEAEAPGQRIRVELMRINGTDRRAVTGSTTNADFSPTFAPDGTTIVFSRETNPATENGRLWKVGVNGQGAQDLIAVSPFREYDPEYSPDGTKVFYSQEVPLNERVYSVDANGLNPTAVSPAGRGASDEPSTSPDGSKVAYSSYRTPVATATMIEVEELSTGATFEAVPPSGRLIPYGPAYSPDGTAIAFARYDAADIDAAPKIYRVAASGGPVTALTGPSTAFESDPYWAPEPTVPTVTVLRQPRRKTKKKKAFFRFTSTDAVGLECRLNRGPIASCPLNARISFPRKRRRPQNRLYVRPYTVDPTAQALGLKATVPGPWTSYRWRFAKRVRTSGG